MQQKSNIFSSAKKRLLYYLDFKGFSQYSFSKETGLSNGFLKSGSSISSDNLNLLHKTYVDLNLLWVITGEGEMLQEKLSPKLSPNKDLDEKREAYLQTTPTIIYRSDPRDTALIEVLQKQVKLLEEKIDSQVDRLEPIKGGDLLEYGADSGVPAPVVPSASTTSHHRRDGSSR